ncbi:hypothetical protein MN116_003949 [Schistosoma mekongi]|uniref:Carboxylesterase type B domain-containing protein n=1 Tax=Schistosoma mekongi TaxID=38744 RepID=A0AAE1ZFF2_SCHME|nr:hypothetical protein MN116_003949 [Schistosoma mekongi]
MQIERVNYGEVANWNDNESLSVTNLRMNRFQRITSIGCLFNIVVTTALIMMTMIVIVFILSYFGVWYGNSQPDIVNIFCGKIKGIQNDHFTIRYLGIPYALPPINENRFKPPIHLSSKNLCHKAWQLSNTTMINSVYYTQHYKSSCLQSLPKSSVNAYSGSENCLYLNVHVPIGRKSVNQAKPVIIIIDGLFLMYSNEPNQPSSETIYKTDAIHVTFNYRIGPLGFLPHPYEKIPNLGLHDQLLVLQWIRNNIAQFGGDPLNVILFGYGSGATCALTLFYSSISNQLFDKLWITAPGLSLSNVSINEVIQTMNYALNCQDDINPNDCSNKKFNNLQNILNIWNWPIVEQWLIDSLFSLPSIHEVTNYKTNKFINILINDNKFVNINLWNKIIKPTSIKPMVIGQTSHEVGIYPTPKTLPFWDKNNYKNYISKKLKMKNLSSSSKYYQQFLSDNFNNMNCTQQDNDTDDDDDAIGEEIVHEDKDWLSNLMLLITDSRLTCPLSELVNKFTNEFYPVYQYYLTGTHRRFDPYSLKGYVSYAFHGWDAMLYLRTYEVHNDFTDPSLLQSLGIDNIVEEMNRLRKISDLLNSAMYQFSRTGYISNWYESKRGRYDVNLIENHKLCKYVNIMKKRCDFWKLLFNNNLFNSTWKF